MPREAARVTKPRAAHRRRLTSGQWFGIVILATVFVAVGVLASVAFLASRGHDVGERLTVRDGVHINPPQKGSWPTDPPSSGEHWPTPAAWGYSDQAIPPETWVHNLEHGGIAVLFNCPDGCPQDQEKIRNFVSSSHPEGTFHEVKIVTASYPVPGHRFALMAWGWRVYMDSWDAALADSFYQAHVNQGPEVVP